MKRCGLVFRVSLCVFLTLPLAASKSDESAIREVIAGLMTDWNAHDIHAFAQLFTSDASFVNVNRSWLQNVAQIEASHKVVHATIFKNSNAEITPAKIRFPASDVAIVHARWRITGDSRRPEPRDYVMTLLLRKKQDTWLILAAQNGSAEDRSTIGFANLRPSDVGPIPAPRPRNGTEEDRISETLSEFDRCSNARDSSALARLFIKDSDYIDVAARWVQGNREIASYIVNMSVFKPQAPNFRSGIERLTFVNHDLAFVQLRRSSKAGIRQT